MEIGDIESDTMDDAKNYEWNGAGRKTNDFLFKRNIFPDTSIFVIGGSENDDGT